MSLILGSFFPGKTQRQSIKCGCNQGEQRHWAFAQYSKSNQAPRKQGPEIGPALSLEGANHTEYRSQGPNRKGVFEHIVGI